MRYRTLSFVLISLLMSANVSQAGHAHGEAVCCPACNYVCEFTTEMVQEKKSCFDVEEKAICIPPVTFPWEKGESNGKGGDCAVGPRCGKVKVVCVLVKQQYECSRCKCKWTAVPIDGEKAGVKQQGRIPEAATVAPDDNSVPPAPPVDPSAQRYSPFKAFMQFAKERGSVSHLFTAAVK